MQLVNCRAAELWVTKPRVRIQHSAVELPIVEYSSHLSSGRLAKAATAMFALVRLSISASYIAAEVVGDLLGEE